MALVAFLDELLVLGLALDAGRFGFLQLGTLFAANTAGAALNARVTVTAVSSDFMLMVMGLSNRGVPGYHGAGRRRDCVLCRRI